MAVQLPTLSTYVLCPWKLSIIYQRVLEGRFWYYKASLEIQTWVGNAQPIKFNTGVLVFKKTWNNIDFKTATNKFILLSRLIGPPKDWAPAQWFIQGNEESIYGKLYKNNMEGLSSFFPVVEGIDYLVNSDTEVALFQFMNLHSFQEYQCKVKTLKKLL